MNAHHRLSVPDTAMVKACAELVRETESELLFNHSNRVFHWADISGTERRLKFDRELLYIAAMFHDMGLTKKCCTQHERFEVDSANAARAFLKSYKISEADINMVWTAIALHTTPGIPQHMEPLIALITLGVEMDNMSFGFEKFTPAQREAVLKDFPRGNNFKEGIINAFYEGTFFKPDTTFGTFNDDVLAEKDPAFKAINYCSLIRNAKWKS